MIYALYFCTQQHSFVIEQAHSVSKSVLMCMYACILEWVVAVSCNESQCAAVCCSVLQCVAVRCSVLQCAWQCADVYICEYT